MAPLRIALLGYGTRGDTQPFVIMARALAQAGHDVWVGAPQNHRGFVTASGVAYRELHGNAQEFLESPQGRAWLASGNVRQLMQGMQRFMHEHLKPLVASTQAACAGAQVIVAQPILAGVVGAVAELQHTHTILAQTFPVTPTAAFASPFMPREMPFGFLNRWSHMLVETLAWNATRKDVQHTRKTLGLAPLTRAPWRAMEAAGTHTLHLYSPLLVGSPEDWDTNQHFTGLLVPDAAMRTGLGEGGLPVELEAFLGAGAPPVFLGFGSMPVLDPAAMLAAVRQVAEQTGTRFVVGAGWSRMEAGGGGMVLIVERANHDALFPRCAAVVHHGGMGTTSAAARAGVPSAVFSVFGDQPFWGRRLQALGVGVHHPFTSLAPNLLAQVTRELAGKDIQAKAAELGRRLCLEDGAGTAVALVERLAGGPTLAA